MKLHLHPNDSTMSEEPDTVEVQEFPQVLPPADKSSDSGNLAVPSAHQQPGITSSYLKSLSHGSSSSESTQVSTGTDITVDYISTHGVMSEDEGDDADEMIGFFHCTQSHFLEPLMSVGGKLTLDSVRIDCSDFLDYT